MTCASDPTVHPAPRSGLGWERLVSAQVARSLGARDHFGAAPDLRVAVVAVDVHADPVSVRVITVADVASRPLHRIARAVRGHQGHHRAGAGGHVAKRTERGRASLLAAR